MAPTRRPWRLNVLKLFAVFTLLFFVLILLMSLDRDLDTGDAAVFASRRNIKSKLSGMLQALQSRNEQEPQKNATHQRAPMSEQKLDGILSKLIVKRNDSLHAPGAYALHVDIHVVHAQHFVTSFTPSHCVQVLVGRA